MVEIAGTPYVTPLNPLFVSFKSDLATVQVEVPLPPGTRVEFDLALPRGNKTVHLVGKVVSVSPDREGRFRMNVRVHTLSREERAALIAENTP